MYIPIGPSKKQLYKIVIALLLLCYILFLGMYKPKAMTIDKHSLNGQGFKADTNDFIAWSGNWTDSDLAGKSGYLIFNLVIEQTNNTYNMIKNITILNGNYACEFGNSNTYSSYSGNYLTQYSVSCPIVFPENGITTIYVGQLGTSTFSYATSLTMSFISDTNISAEEISQIVSINSYYTQEVIKDKINEIKSILSTNNQTQQNIQNNTQDISDNLNDSSIDSSSANNLTNNSAFQDSNGLDAIIKAPLNFIQSLTSSTCSAINLTIPYIDADVSLPCMSSVYTKALGTQLVNLIALVINGVVLYRYCLKILQLVHNAKNPNKDELEVLDL